MLQADNLSKSYSADPIFEGVCFQLQKGEKCALVGRNGSGKTTLFKILKGEETSDAGSFHAPKGYSLGFLEQHITFTEKTALEEALSGPISKEPYEVESILFGLGFNDAMLHADPSSLSGGYHLRLKLAKLLAKEPDCLLLDEPTNYLDIAGLRWLEGYLKSWRKECILISHDRSFLDSVITHTMGLHRKGLKILKTSTRKS
jgi:ATP-binding cassette, subfamily F, member 3